MRSPTTSASSRQRIFGFWRERGIVSGAGGRILADAYPVVLYRQHGRNLIGATASRHRRALAALRRGPAAFMSMFRQNVADLAAHTELLSPAARSQLIVICRGLHAGPWQRLTILMLPGFARQTSLETLLFRLWFLLG